MIAQDTESLVNGLWSMVSLAIAIAIGTRYRPFQRTTGLLKR